MADNRSYGQGGPYRPQDPEAAGGDDDRGAGGRTMDQQQQQLNDIRAGVRGATSVMKETIVSMDALSKKTDITRDRTENLMGSSEQFRRGANKVRKQMWWKDMKMRICLVVGIIVLLLIIIIPSVVATRH